MRTGGFYGWPWFYIGNHPVPRHKGRYRELASKVIVPDVLVQAHSAALNLCFYTGDQFPAEYKGDIFAAFHGSWNRIKRTGYRVVRVPLRSFHRQSARRVRRFRDGFCHARWECLGQTGWNHRRQKQYSPNQRRRQRHHLASELQEVEFRNSEFRRDSNSMSTPSSSAYS